MDASAILQKCRSQLIEPYYRRERVKSGTIYAVISILLLLCAVYLFVGLISVLIPGEPGGLLAAAEQGVEAVERVIDWGVWISPFILFGMGLIAVFSIRNPTVRPALFFTLLLLFTVLLFCFLLAASTDSLLIALLPDGVSEKTAAAGVLVLLLVELCVFFLWFLAFSKRRGTPGSRKKPVLSKRDRKRAERFNRSYLSAGKKKRGETKLRGREKERREKTFPAPAAGKASEEVISEDPAEFQSKGPAEPEIQIFPDEDDDPYSLRFPNIPDLPDLTNRVKAGKPLQQEMSFEETEGEEAFPEPPDEEFSASSAEAEKPAVEHQEQDTLFNDELDRTEWEEDILQDEPVSDAQDEEPEDEFSSDEEDSGYEPAVLGLSAAKEEAAGELFSSFRKGNYLQPSDSLLVEYPDISSTIDEHTKEAGETLMQTLREFKIEAKITGIQKGPVVTMYEILPAPGIRIQTIANLADNIALQLAAKQVRIVAPIPGKQAVGIEVPNKKRSIVGFREMLQEIDRDDDTAIPMILGTDISGKKQIIDLSKTPHLLIAGATGSGKSVCVNSLICSILYRRSPKEVRLMMVDPKIVELKLYNDIPHLLTPVITEPKKALKALQYCLLEMERRYSLLDSLGARDLKSYNRRVLERKLAREKLPYLVVIIDEFADLMATGGKELEGYLARLAAMARAVGIHIVLATQRPSADVITGLIKANIPSRIAFMVTSNGNSRIIIDQVGAEKLLGRGDMLFSSSWDPSPSRIQGAFLTEEEVERIVAHVKQQGEPDYLDESYFEDDDADDEGEDDIGDDEDVMMQEALQIARKRGTVSASLLQRRLKIGYNRAARIVEEMEDRGIVGPQQGSKPREVLRMPGTE